MTEQMTPDIARLIDENARMRNEVEALTTQRDRLLEAVGDQMDQGAAAPSGVEELRLLVQNLRAELGVHRNAHRLHSQQQDRRVADLEALCREITSGMEHQGRDIEDLGAAMGNAQLALNGLAKSTYTPDSDH